MKTERSVYFINQLVRADDGGYIPCIAVENEPGFYKTDWNWGSDLDLAWQYADEKNKAMGYTPEEVCRIVFSSMFPQKGDSDAQES